ncbi:MAG: PHP domain-containing protein [Halobacteriaceae archaeon]
MVYADLHVHTTASDGTLAPSAVPGAAADADLGAVAVTDHDTVHEDFEAPVVSIDGVEVICGVELRVEAAAGRVDLLGYGLTPTPDLRAELDRLGRDRRERGEEMVAATEAELGISLDVTVDRSFGRPHLARAIAAHPAAPYDEAGAFEHLIGVDGPCYVARDVTAFDRGATLLADACGLVSLAHPLRYDDTGAALSLTADDRIGGVERAYPYDRTVTLDRVDRAIERHDLVATGGSDAHGAALGARGLDRDDYQTVAARLGQS